MTYGWRRRRGVESLVATCLGRLRSGGASASLGLATAAWDWHEGKWDQGKRTEEKVAHALESIVYAQIEPSRHRGERQGNRLEVGCRRAGREQDSLSAWFDCLVSTHLGGFNNSTAAYYDCAQAVPSYLHNSYLHALVYIVM